MRPSGGKPTARTATGLITAQHLLDDPTFLFQRSHAALAALRR
jgi:hypothetical protein